jgi:hypothetical protein
MSLDTFFNDPKDSASSDSPHNINHFVVDNDVPDIEQWFELEKEEQDLMFGEPPGHIRSIDSSSVDAFLFERKAYAQIQNMPRKEPDDMTHIILTGEHGGGFVVSSDEKEYAEFLRMYANDIHSGGFTHYVVEKRTPIFNFYCDLDIKRKQQLQDESVLELVKDLIHCVRTFYPPTTDPARFDVIVLRTKIGAKKTGVHPVFPNLLVNKGQAMFIREYFVAFLIQKYGTMEGIQNSWDDVVNECVYTLKGLALVGSNKCIKCPECKSKRDLQRHCGSCRFKGKVDIGRRYMPWRYIHDGEVDESKAEYLGDIQRCIYQCSIRSNASEPMSGFVITDSTMASNAPEENKEHLAPRTADSAPLMRTLKTKYGTYSMLGEDYDTVSRQKGKVYVNPNSERFRLISDHLQSRAFPKVYNQLVVHDIFTNANESFYQVNVRGEGSHYCQNYVKGNHINNSIYFYITNNGIYQKCYCRCKSKEYRRKGFCCDYLSDSHMIPRKLQQALFPATKSRVGRLRMERDQTLLRNRDGHFTALSETLAKLADEIAVYEDERAREIRVFENRAANPGNAQADNGIREVKRRRRN